MRVVVMGQPESFLSANKFSQVSSIVIRPGEVQLMLHYFGLAGWARGQISCLRSIGVGRPEACRLSELSRPTCRRVVEISRRRDRFGARGGT